MNELVETGKGGELADRPTEEIAAPVYQKELVITPDTPGVDYSGLLNKAMQVLNLADIASKIRAGAEYIVQIPVEYQQGFEQGEYFIMENMKTHKLWPSLMKVAEDGRKKVVTPLPIKKELRLQGNPVQDITTGFHNMHMQKQMENIAEQLQEVITIVKAIEAGQKTSRIAKMESGREQIISAIGRREKDDGWKNELALGRQSLYDARWEFMEAMKQKIEAFAPVPKTAIGRYFREIGDGGYSVRRDKEYQEIEEYFALYLQATGMLAGSYAIVGDMDSAKQVFARSKTDLRSIDYRNFSTIQYLHKKSSFEGFYSFAPQYVAREEQKCMTEAQDYDCLSFTISGEKLLEAISDGRTEGIQESED